MKDPESAVFAGFDEYIDTDLLGWYADQYGLPEQVKFNEAIRNLPQAIDAAVT